MSTTQTQILPVILSGGTGTRLWPLSREGYPKQFWPLASSRPMLEETAARAEGPGFLPPMVVCNEAHRFLVAEQLRGRGARIVLEPVGRNSAPAIAAAALLAEEASPGTVMWIMAADSAVADVPALHAALAQAAAAAVAGRIVTFGMTPTAPETGYGYIEAGDALPGLPGVQAIARFVEKPDAARAAEFVAGGRHLWNSGMFVATASSILAELERHEPLLLAAVRRAVEGAKRDMDFVRLDAEAFTAAPSISIDYAVMERTRQAAVVPASIGWSDIGSWAALWEISAKDAAGNVGEGPVEIIDSRNCFVRSEGIVTGVVGLEDAVVVVTDDAVMERPRQAAVVPASIGWSDIGSWAALWEISAKDAAGNVGEGPVEIIDSRNCFVRSEGIVTGVVGLEDAVVVVTDDAVLAMHRDRAQDVKKLVDALKAKGRKEATEHRRAYRPWGHYEGLIMGDRFQVKKIQVRPGAKLSLQKHFHRAEHWVVVSGTAIVRRDEEEILLRENESVYLPLGCVHRMENPGMIPLVLIEVQSGSYLGEDDIVRFEDTYGRA